MDSERDKSSSESAHLKKSAQYSSIQIQLRALENDQTKNIQKARPFFEMTEIREQQLNVNKFIVSTFSVG